MAGCSRSGRLPDSLLIAPAQGFERQARERRAVDESELSVVHAAGVTVGPAGVVIRATNGVSHGLGVGPRVPTPSAEGRWLWCRRVSIALSVADAVV
jgi:hypothetical protein